MSLNDVYGMGFCFYPYNLFVTAFLVDILVTGMKLISTIQSLIKCNWLDNVTCFHFVRHTVV